MQAQVFFGHEPSLGTKVVLKQYKNDLRGIFREIRIFTEIERLKKNAHRQNFAQIIDDVNKHDLVLP